MTIDVLFILTFVLPPALGAAIGYITNAIAIRMLFRPLGEKRILGVRIPFTPGIIPRQRGQLAESIGKMVSQRLLTEEVLREKIESPQFRAGLQERVAGFSSAIVTAADEQSDTTEESAGDTAGGSQGAGESLLGFPATDDEDREVLNERLFEFASLLIERFLKSDALETMVRTIVRYSLEGIGSVTLSEIFRDRKRALQSAGDLIEEVLGGPVSETVTELAQRWADQQTEANTTVGRYITEDVIEQVESLVDSGYQPVFDYLIDWLRRDDMRDELAYRGRIILREILDRLNLVQRFLVSAGQYERQLRDRMPVIVDDFIDNLDRTGRLPQNRRRVVQGIGDALRKVQQLGIRDAQATLEFDLRETVGALLPRVFEILQSDAVRDGLVQSLDELFDRYADRPLEEILTELTGMESEQITERIMVTVKEWLERPGATKDVSDGVVSAMRRFMKESRMTLHSPLVEVEPAQKRAIDEFLSDRIVNMVSSRLPELVAAFNVHQMVVDRINSLDIENVERLLLMVIARHLKWINLFGAVLGSLIGGVQVLLNVFL